MSSSDGTSADEEANLLTQKALFVSLPTRPIDMDTIPQDGSEYIHKSRLEAKLCDKIQQKEAAPIEFLEENEQKLMKQRARKAAIEFKRYGLALNTIKYKEYLIKKFPKKLEFPKVEPKFIQEWCHFCLGSKLCSEIYGEKYEKPDKEIKGHLPVLSIVVHFNQDTVFTVLQHLHEWFLRIGMQESLGRWVYAVLSCIEKPLEDDFEELIETFQKDCKKRLKDCDELERSRLYLFSAIFECYFCINSDKVGPTLESLLNLNILS